MKIVNSNEYGMLSEQTLEKFEKQLGTRLPDDYRQFLLSHNGGDPEPATFKCSLEEDDIRSFFGLHKNKNYSLDNNLAVYKGRVDSDFLPIACDDFGNLVCLALDGPTKNQVFFWDHELEGSSMAHGKIAASFSDFTNKLYEYNDPDAPEESLIKKLVQNNDLPKIKLLIENGYDVEKEIPEYERTLIEVATINNKIDIVKYLVNRGCHIHNSLHLA